MRRTWTAAVACAVVAAVAVWLTLFRASEEDRIRETLVRVTRAVMVKDGDNMLTRSLRLKRELGDTLEEGVRVEVPDLGVRAAGRQQVIEHAARAGVLFTSADCELVNMTIGIDESETTAKVDATALVTGVRSGTRRVDRRDVHFLLRKDGTWRVTTIDVRGAD